LNTLARINNCYTVLSFNTIN